jgi:hypothetical protein
VFVRNKWDNLRSLAYDLCPTGASSDEETKIYQLREGARE